MQNPFAFHLINMKFHNPHHANVCAVLTHFYLYNKKAKNRFVQHSLQQQNLILFHDEGEELAMTLYNCELSA